MRRGVFFQKSACTLITTVFAATQVLLYAPTAAAAERKNDKITQYADQGLAFGKDSRNWATRNMPTLQGSKITIPTQQNNKTIEIQDYNKMSGSDDQEHTAYKTDTTVQRLKDLEEVYNDPDERAKLASSQKDALMDSVTKLAQMVESGQAIESTTIETTVYQIIRDTAENRVTDLSADASLNLTRSVMTDLADIVDDLANCGVETSKVTKSEVVHTPDIKVCQQVLDRSGECEIDHEYGGGIVSLLDPSKLNISTCEPVNGYSCTQIWLGKVGNNYLPGKGCQNQCKRMESRPTTCKKYEWRDIEGTGTDGIIHKEQEKFCVEWNYEDYCAEYHTVCSCALYFENLYYQLKNLNALISAQLVYAAYDDYMRVRIGAAANPQVVYSGPIDPFPFDLDGNPVATGSCELSTHWIWDPTGLRYKNGGFGCTESSCRINDTANNSRSAVDVTGIMKSIGEGGIGTFRWEAAASGAGEAYALLKFYYDPTKIANNDTWGPTGCLDAALGVQDGVAKGSITCADLPQADSSGCVLVDMVPVCPEAIAESPLSGIDKMCRKVKVESNFSFYKGDTGCWQAYVGLDKDGNPMYEEICGGENAGGNLDTCDDLVKQGCTFLSSECTEGMRGESGNCYVADLKYDCGTDTIVEKESLDTEYECKGIRCLGTECAEVHEEKNLSFAKVNAMLNMLQQAAQNMECTGTDEEGNVTGLSDVECEIFKGEKGSCKIAVGGWQNCCKENSSTPDFFTYMKTITGIAKMGEAAYEFGTNANYYISINTIHDTSGATGKMADMMGQFASFIDRSNGSIIKTLSNIDSALFNKAFTTAADNVGKLWSSASSAVSEFFSPVTTWIKDLQLAIEKEIESLLTKMFGKMGYSTIAGSGVGTGGAQFGAGQSVENVGASAAQKAAQEAMANVMSAVAVVGYVYLAYQVASMIIQLVYACEEEEMETVSKNAIKSCHYLGSYCKSKVLGVCIVKVRSYCCYETPLARIVNEQIRLQTDTVTNADGTVVAVPRIADWGTAKEPNCQGVAMADFDKVDWDAVDLSEWTNLLEINGLSMDQDAALTLKSMTGQATTIK